MKTFIRFLLTFFLAISVLLCFAYFFWHQPEYNTTEQDAYKSKVKKFTEDLIKLKSKAVSLKEYAVTHGYYKDVVFLVDMSQPSGQNRFFVFDLEKESIKNSGLVAHGRCNQLLLSGRKYSNEPGSGCTSLGKYRIGKSYYGKFGLAYKLHGLENTNDKAFSRFVVLHAHECVPDAETPDEICQSDGCPTVSPAFLQQLKTIIQKSSKPVLLWIYE